ncbi:nuclear transport factor 2 family protein [Mesorhizobium dulcispinae]|uniref:nuclear transport factor 2 family protein n=1 Tax=Mesorhizobium dulcispinae TaxID=3072316 RepID=UPI002A23EE1C|nr:nuclear transport factor 2 family protein [Mesorhizobium sp. VK23D]MDX8520650.1 nuclear transport factor 2 family protein [Mesorhizobium sp. VK23D]
MNAMHSKEVEDVRGLIEQWADAVRRKDMDGILRHHAPDFVMFDVPPPLQSRGIEAYRDTWPLFFGASPQTPVFDIVDLKITAGTDVAFAIALMRCVEVKATGSNDLDFRLTICFEKIAGQWTFMHEHHSVPAIEEP